MNNYKPLEKAKSDGTASGIWHMTVTNDRITTPIGYCRINKNSETECLHQTPEEASDCYRNYIRKECNGKLPGGFDLDDGENQDGTVFWSSSSY